MGEQEVKNKKKIRIIVLSIIIGVALLVAAALFLFPRIVLYSVIQSTVPDVGKPAVYFTEYDVTAQNTYTIDNGHISVDIPMGYVLNERLSEATKETATIYRKDSYNIIIMKPADFGDTLNFLNPNNFDVSEFGVNMNMDLLTDGYEKIGNGLPQSAYENYKTAYLLENSDYSFFSLKKATAYMITAAVKQMAESSMNYDDVYVYERDDVRAFLKIKENDGSDTSEGKYEVQLDIYTTDNLNEITTLMFNIDSPEEAYAIINSARGVS